jgi:phage FluMu protein Com
LCKTELENDCMALRIRCTKCDKKISIDEAFAGGVCRCPYCKAIVPVGGSAEGSPAQARPATPAGARPARPADPNAAGQASPTPAEGQMLEEPATADEAGPASAQEPQTPAAPVPAPPGRVPTARPVMLQGLMTIVLLVLILVMIGVTIALVVILGSPSEPTQHQPRVEPGPQYQAPLEVQQGTAAVAGVSIEPPVVYVIDHGAGMRRMHDRAKALARYSLRSLEGDQQFGMILAQQTGPASLSDKLVTAGKPGEVAAKDFLDEYPLPGGASDLSDAVAGAIRMKPATVVILARKSPENVDALAAMASEAGVKISAVALEPASSDLAALEQMAKKTGGAVRSMTSSEIDDAFSTAEPLD